MSKTKEVQYQCPKAGRQVVLSRTVFRGVSGIGDDSVGVHVEHACSIENACRQRIDSTCPVRKLDAAT